MTRTFLVIAGTILAVAASGGPASAQLTSRDAVCRHKVAQATRMYASYRVERALYCHKLRIQGKIPAAIDCNDPSTWPGHGFTRGVFLHGKDRALHPGKVRTCRPDAANLAALGYASCPAPCDALPVGTFDELSACMLCVADACMAPALDAAYGTPPLPANYKARKCIERAGRHMKSYFHARGFVQQLCQVKKERQYPNWVGVPDCLDVEHPSHPFHRFLNSFRTRKNRVLGNRCSEVDVATETDSCGSDPTSLITCVNAAADQCSDALFPIFFPTP